MTKSEPYLDNINSLAAVARQLDAAMPAHGHGTCRHCGKPLVFKPYWLDGKLPNPPVWIHEGHSRTCSTRPDDWPEDSWPSAEPLEAQR